MSHNIDLPGQSFLICKQASLEEGKVFFVKFHSRLFLMGMILPPPTMVSPVPLWVPGEFWPHSQARLPALLSFPTVPCRGTRLGARELCLVHRLTAHSLSRPTC